MTSSHIPSFSSNYYQKDHITKQQSRPSFGFVLVSVHAFGLAATRSQQTRKHVNQLSPELRFAPDDAQLAGCRQAGRQAGRLAGRLAGRTADWAD